VRAGGCLSLCVTISVVDACPAFEGLPPPLRRLPTCTKRVLIVGMYAQQTVYLPPPVQVRHK
jgi:hypothetical protein